MAGSDVLRVTLRSKFLLSLAVITALLTTGVLLIVRYRVQIHVREDLTQALRTSVVAFQSLQQQRAATLERSAALLATLPPLKAVMTSGDRATIQDASRTFWELAGSQVFVLADTTGAVVAIHTATPGFTAEAAQAAIQRYLTGAESRDWWYGGGHLFQVFLQPIYFGSPETGRPIGLLAVGYEVDAAVAADVSRVASGLVSFEYQKQVVVGTVPPSQRGALAGYVAQLGPGQSDTTEVQLGSERYLATSVAVSQGRPPAVTLTVLKSFDEAAAFLENLNTWIITLGVVSVVAGCVLVFFVSTTFTNPLSQLLAGVRALETGDFSYPLSPRGSDEVSALTAAFLRMRTRIQETQRQLLEAEQLATIGRMANTISHDLRHPLTSILAYAEFLGERSLSDAQRKDFYQEIRIAVNRMIDEINSLLGFSRQREAVRPASGHADAVIDRAIRTVKALPEYETSDIVFTHDGPCIGWFDAGKLERVILNLLFNAVEAVPLDGGRVTVACASKAGGIEITVSDNGRGIPPEIHDSLFQPFVSHGKEKGIGLGLTVVQDIMRQHGGEVRLERTGPAGTTFVLRLPLPPPAAAGAA